MYDKDEYIQLPPLKRELEPVAVLLLWEYAKLSEEARKEVLEDTEIINNKTANDALPKKYRTVTKEEQADYEEALGNLMRSIVQEVSGVAGWVFCRKYIDGWTLEQMLSDIPKAEKFIIVMDTLFEKNIKVKEPDD